MWQRLCAAGLAVLILWVLVVRVQLSMAANDTGVAEASWAVYRFFTIWTNTLVGVACGYYALTGRLSGTVSGGLLLAICLVGLVYHALLARLVDYSGMDAVVDLVVHTVVPLGFAAIWVVFLPKAGVGFRDVPLWLGYPLVYCLFALARGAADGTYPYPFLDITKIGWSGVAVNVVGLLVVFALAGAIIVGISKVLTRRGV